MTGLSRITTADGETTVFDPHFGLTIRGRSIAEIEQERRRLGAADTHQHALQRWVDDGGMHPPHAEEAA